MLTPVGRASAVPRSSRVLHFKVESRAVNTIPKVMALEASAAGLFLINRLPDRMTANDLQWDAQAGVWRVPTLLAYPLIGLMGEVGEIIVSHHEAWLRHHG